MVIHYTRVSHRSQTDSATMKGMLRIVNGQTTVVDIAKRDSDFFKRDRVMKLFEEGKVNRDGNILVIPSLDRIGCGESMVETARKLIMEMGMTICVADAGLMIHIYNFEKLKGTIAAYGAAAEEELHALREKSKQGDSPILKMVKRARKEVSEGVRKEWEAEQKLEPVLREAKRLYEDCMLSILEVAKYQGCSKTTASRRLERAGAKMRKDSRGCQETIKTSYGGIMTPSMYLRWVADMENRTGITADAVGS